MRTWKDREELVEARGAEYRAGEMTEDQFRGYLFAMRYRGHDITHELGNYAPPAPGQTFEERRMEASKLWLKNYRNC